MAKLYPPSIENCIMFKTHIEIPFKHNMSVNQEDTNLGYALRIKTISSNKEIINSKAGIVKNNKIYFNIEADKDKIQYGEYYKIQVAYVKKEIVDDKEKKTVGYYSTFAIARCTSQIASYSFSKDTLIPNKFHLVVNRGTLDKDDVLYTYRVWLCKLKPNFNFNYEGLTNQTIQRSFLEQVKSSSFKSNFTIEDDTNTQIIDKSDDIVFSFKDVNFDLNKKFQYFLVAKITTTNGLVLKTAPTLIPLVTDSDDLASSLSLGNNFEYGYIWLKNNDSSTCYLSKKSDKGYQPLCALGKGNYYYDFCIEQGQIYTYALGKNKYVLNDLELEKADAITTFGSSGLKNIRADYEDMSLWDGKYILRLKYNPQVSSFKTTKSEQKVETLGSQYPFVFYNNKVGYKEFPISAFIATEMDNNEYINSRKLMKIKNFDKRRETTASSDSIYYGHGQISKDDTIYTEGGEVLSSTESSTTNPTLELWSTQKTTVETDDVQLISGVRQGPLYSVKPENNLLTLPTLEDSFIDIAEEFKNERIFKNKVMDWLNNGKPKLFRSPQEGMFIVQIMGVSMSPNDQLARKMHTVQMNAVEIAECNYENLIKYGLMLDALGKSNKGEIIYSDFMDYSSYSSLNALE